MNARQCKWISIFLFLVFFVHSQAQDLSGRFGIGLLGSAVKMVGGETDRSTIDQWAGLQMKYGYTKSLAFDALIGLGWVYPRDPGGSQFESCGGYKTLLLPFRFDAVYHLFPDRFFRPYFSAGAGITQWDIRKTDGKGIFSAGTSVNGAKYSASVCAGLGFEFFLSRDIIGDIGFHYHRLLKDNVDTMGLGDDANDGIIELRFGLSYFWGGFRDADGDGIEDKVDGDKYNPEDFDGFKDQDGIPDYDNDRDGIPDKLDKAPNKPEDKDGFQDDDGIPDPDNDGDGILDIRDRCPFVAEDFDGFQDEDGCPDPDNDGDGIPDSLDQCPNWPEDFNDYMDHDGCPDQKPEPPPIQKGEKIILRGVNFASNSAALTGESYKTLIDAAEILLKHEDIEVEIRGYTDNIGDWRHNQILSERRAQAVRLFLISKGVTSNRLTAVGYGERDPISTNLTKEGRSQNRRIEFVRVQ